MKNEVPSKIDLEEKQKQAASLLEIARTYRIQKEYPSSINGFLSAISIFELLNDIQTITKVYLEIAQTYQEANVLDKALHYSLDSYLFAKGLKNEGLEILTTQQMGHIYFAKQEYDEAINKFEELLIYRQKQGDLSGQLFALESLAESKKEQKNYRESLFDYSELLKLSGQESKQNLFVAKIYTNLGFLNQRMNKRSEALEFFEKAVTIYQKTPTNKIKSAFLADSYLNIALNKTSVKDFDNAAVYYQKAISIKKKHQDKQSIAQLTNYFAINSFLANDRNNAFKFAFEAEKIAKKGKFPRVLLEIYEVLAQMYKKESAYKESNQYYVLHGVIKDSLNAVKQEEEKRLAQRQIEINRSENEFKLQIVSKENQGLQLIQLKLEAKEREKDLTLSKKNAELRRADFEMERLEKERIENLLALVNSDFQKNKQRQKILLLEKEQSEKNLALKEEIIEKNSREKDLQLVRKNNLLLEKDRQLREEEMQKQAALQKYFIYFAFFGGVAFVIVALSLVSTYRKNKQLEHQEKEIREQNDTLQGKQAEILKQKQVIEEQHDDLKWKSQQVEDGIKAASLIQQAVLPENMKFQRLFNNHFIFYKPKDVVSGDFYWLYESGNKIFFAVVDCTGHGISGALTAMIGATLLDKIVGLRQVHEPAEILDQLHHEIEASFDGEQTRSYYGMDLGLISIEKYSERESKVVFAGAKRPLYYTLPGSGSTLIELKGTRRTIGGRAGAKRKFTSEELILPKGTVVYMTTDGFSDQSDEEGNRFGSHKLKEFLSQISDLSIKDQLIFLKYKFKNFKGNASQRDDILLVTLEL